MVAFRLAPARLSPGERVYAIGDVHGCLDRLAALHGLIAEDLAQRPIARPTVIHLGDLIDRGPKSAGVIELLCRPWTAGSPSMVNLTGNHEEMCLRALGGRSPAAVDHWLENGGSAALKSWGADPLEPPDTWLRTIPPAHLRFLRRLGLTHGQGGYVFVHAGLRPGRPMAEQVRDDLLWIREPFLSATTPFPAVVVHGHSPAPEPELRSNRINVDTGAVAGGRLTCAVLEEDRVGFLDT